MNKQEGTEIVERLRRAARAGAPVVELVGEEAKSFAFVRDRSVLLGSFSVDAGKKFFVSLASSSANVNTFQLLVFEKLRGNPVLASSYVDGGGIIWTYQAAKQTGDNQARKRAFLEAAKAESITIPLPNDDIGDFSAAIHRAIDLRRLADAAGGTDDSTWQPPEPELPPRSRLPPSRTSSRTVAGIVWQLCTSNDGATLGQVQDAIDQLGLDGSHSAKAMLTRYAVHHGCVVTVSGTGPQARYRLIPPDAERPDNRGGIEPGSRSDFEDVLDQLRTESLSFSAELVASYLLALQAKRFVLLTGISGTGKTKLAQEVARAFDAAASSASSPDDESVTIEAKPYHRKYARFIVPAVLAQEFDALRDPSAKQIDLQVPGLPRSPMTISKRAGNSSLLEVLLSGSVREWFMSNVQVGDQFTLSRHIDGDDEWLELRLPESSNRRARPTGASTEVIAVRPDWTDKSSILGFYNPLTNDYLPTPILRLLLRARDEVAAAVDGRPRPYFLIFDEMNLARVEHYFSDFLSAMESGEAIHLHEDAQVEEVTGIPRRLSLPRNLFVIGTVNVDETTYMFSPKVLDRAFVLEFNEVDLDGLAGTIRIEEAESTPLALTRMEGGLELRGAADDAEWRRFEDVLGGAAAALVRKLHAALAIENRHFGYRVAREIARFVVLAVDQTAGGDAAARAALDVAVLAKILPKLHGSQAELEQLLKGLMSIAIGEQAETEVFSPNGAILDGLAAGVVLPRTARKLWRMQRRLRVHGFASFIE